MAGPPSNYCISHNLDLSKHYLFGNICWISALPKACLDNPIPVVDRMHGFTVDGSHEINNIIAIFYHCIRKYDIDHLHRSSSRVIGSARTLEITPKNQHVLTVAALIFDS